MDHKKSIRLYSLLGQRGTFGTILKQLATENDSIIALSADLTRTSGLEQYTSSFPDRMFNVGIAEQNAVGMAAGLADQGKVPFVTTFANFAALRANEFVRHFMSYMQCNVKLIGLGSGFAMELFGNTHYGLEDIAAIKAMPNITIFSPADGLEVAKCTEYAAETYGPMYIRLSGKMNNPIVYKQDYEFIPGKAVKLSEGEDAVIFATGSMVSVAQKAVKMLADKGLGISLFNIHTIKPIDEEIILSNKDKRVIITVEEHCITGGLGSSVAEVLSAQRKHGKLIRMGTGDRYKAAGDFEYMLEQHGLTAEGIYSTITEELIKS